MVEDTSLRDILDLVNQIDRDFRRDFNNFTPNAVNNRLEQGRRLNELMNSFQEGIFNRAGLNAEDPDFKAILRLLIAHHKSLEK